MAVISFNKQKGSAKTDAYEMKPGMNRVRLVGGVLPRYVWWIPHKGMGVPVECLEFNRDSESFDRVEKDHIRDYYPDVRSASWGYIATAIDLDEPGKIQPFFLKKKLWEQIMVAAEDLGDPTDPVSGWDVIFEKKKTGGSRLNVEYNLHTLKCKNREMTDEEKALLTDIPDLEKLYPRPSPEEQKKGLDNLRDEQTEKTDSAIDEEFEDLA